MENKANLLANRTGVRADTWKCQFSSHCSPTKPPQAGSFTMTYLREPRSPESEVSRLSPDREEHPDVIYHSEKEKANNILLKKIQHWKNWHSILHLVSRTPYILVSYFTDFSPLVSFASASNCPRVLMTVSKSSLHDFILFSSLYIESLPWWSHLSVALNRSLHQWLPNLLSSA